MNEVITQMELLSEGFWKSFGRGIRGGVRAGATIARQLAPEVTRPLDSLQNSIVDVRNAYRMGREGIPEPKIDKLYKQEDLNYMNRARNPLNSKVKKKTIENMKIGLLKKDLTLNDKKPIKFETIDSRSGVKLYRVYVKNNKTNKEEKYLIDTSGEIHKDT